MHDPLSQKCLHKFEKYVLQEDIFDLAMTLFKRQFEKGDTDITDPSVDEMIRKWSSMFEGQQTDKPGQLGERQLTLPNFDEGWQHIYM